MALPNTVDYRQTPTGFYMKNSDGSGPYRWDGTTMELVSAGEMELTGVDTDDSLLTNSAVFNRPADVTAYSIGDLVANNTAAGSVLPMSIALTNDLGGAAIVRKARLHKSGTSVANAFFSLHLYRSYPTPANGDNGTWLTNQSSNYLGRIDFGQMTAFNDGACANGVPAVGGEIFVKFGAGLNLVYGLLEAKGAYTPASGEAFTVTLESDEE